MKDFYERLGNICKYLIRILHYQYLEKNVLVFLKRDFYFISTEKNTATNYILPFIIFPSEYLKTFLCSNCVEVAWNPGYKISVKTLGSVCKKESIHPKNKIKFGCYSVHNYNIVFGTFYCI